MKIVITGEDELTTDIIEALKNGLGNVEIVADERALKELIENPRPEEAIDSIGVCKSTEHSTTIIIDDHELLQTPHPSRQPSRGGKN